MLGNSKYTFFLVFFTNTFAVFYRSQGKVDQPPVSPQQENVTRPLPPPPSALLATDPATTRINIVVVRETNGDGITFAVIITFSGDTGTFHDITSPVRASSHSLTRFIVLFSHRLFNFGYLACIKLNLSTT